ncbi:hypothetical protein DMC47_44025 [Nostoc sp. 3335mG]|nr:hypothetical protein DMC47_44025 [Nostoc sp. 3335mG]
MFLVEIAFTQIARRPKLGIDDEIPLYSAASEQPERSIRNSRSIRSKRAATSASRAVRSPAIRKACASGDASSDSSSRSLHPATGIAGAG